MKRITGFVLKKLGLRDDELLSAPARSRAGAAQGWISIVVNFMLFLIKGILGLMTGSLALSADAVHTLSDTLSSAVIVFSFRAARKPSDAAHPFGHGRMEAIATLAVSLLLLVAGFELLKESVIRIFNPVIFEAAWWLLGVILATAAVKEFLARFSSALALRIDSPAIKADSWHHRSDALSSLLVFLAVLGQRLGFYYLDSGAGIAVSLLIFYTGWNIAKRGIDDLLGSSPSPKLIREIKSLIMEFPDILDVHDLVIHQYGRTMVLSYHIVISDEYSLAEAHALTEKVEKKVNDRFDTYSTIHLDPVNIRDPRTRQIRSFLAGFLENLDVSTSFHDLRTGRHSGNVSVRMDLVVDPEMKDKEIRLLIKQMKNALKSRFPEIQDVIVEVEPKYAF